MKIITFMLYRISFIIQIKLKKKTYKYTPAFMFRFLEAVKEIAKISFKQCYRFLDLPAIRVACISIAEV